MPEKVGIILVNYNGKKHIAGCIDSLLAQTYKNIEILFWDNHSTDASAELVKQMYPQIHLIESPCNHGFAEANNLAVKEMLKRGAQYLLLLNVDTVADPFLVEYLIDSADENTVTTAKIRMGRRGREIWYAGGRLLFEKGDAEHCNMKDCKNATPVTFISGCCMMIHRDIIKKHGLFDTDYYLYYEDTDLCMRWHMEGVRMHYIPNAGLWHKVGGSSGGIRNPLKEYYMARNRLHFANKYKKYTGASMPGVMCRVIKDEMMSLPDFDFRLIMPACWGIIDYCMKKTGRSSRKII